MIKCEHKWVDIEDGTNDKFCVKCRMLAKQASTSIPMSQIGINVKPPNLKDLAKEIDKEMNRSARIYGT